MKKRVIETVILLLKGGVIGVANIIPGVSGGTLAVVMGIYDRLITAITGFFERPARRVEYVLFLGRIFIGAAVAILLLANLMDYLLQEHFQKTMFLFMGLIIGGVPAVVMSHGDMRIRTSRILSFVVGMIIVLGLSLLGKEPAEPALAQTVAVEGIVGYVMVFIGGFFAGGAMIVPGVSGSFILVLMGQYALIISSIKTLAVKPLVFMAFGAALGILVFSKVIELCLEKIPAVTYYFILGLIFASLCKIFPGIPDGTGDAVLCAVSLLVGVAVAYLISRMSVEE